MKPIYVSAINFASAEGLFHPITGALLPEEFAGYCKVYFKNGRSAVFKTYFEDNERQWECMPSDLQWEFAK